MSRERATAAPTGLKSISIISNLAQKVGKSRLKTPS